MITERLSREVAASLWSIYHERPDAPRLIWPAKRDDSTRVSEQESKILITQWLEYDSGQSRISKSNPRLRFPAAFASV